MKHLKQMATTGYWEMQKRPLESRAATTNPGKRPHQLTSNQRNWISPFAHIESCRDNKKMNLSLNKCQNIERSFYVNHCLSLNSQLKPDRIYKILKTS